MRDENREQDERTSRTGEVPDCHNFTCKLLLSNHVRCNKYRRAREPRLTLTRADSWCWAAAIISVLLHSTLIHRNTHLNPTHSSPQSKANWAAFLHVPRWRPPKGNCIYFKNAQKWSWPGQRVRGEAVLLAALLFQAGVGFRKIRHFYLVISSVSCPANAELCWTEGKRL